MKKFFEKPKNEPERLTAAQARAIPIDDSLVENVLQEIYKRIREVASRGGSSSEFSWCYSSFSDDVKEIVKQRLKNDGYHVVESKSGFVWKVIWKEL